MAHCMQSLRATFDAQPSNFQAGTHAQQIRQFRETVSLSFEVVCLMARGHILVERRFTFPAPSWQILGSPMLQDYLYNYLFSVMQITDIQSQMQQPVCTPGGSPLAGGFRRFTITLDSQLGYLQLQNNNTFRLVIDLM